MEIDVCEAESTRNFAGGVRKYSERQERVPMLFTCISRHTGAPGSRCGDHTGRSLTLGLRLLMATWLRESLNDLQSGLSVSRTAKFSVLNVGGTGAASMADAADVVMSEAPKAATDAKLKKGAGKQKGGADSSTTAEAPAKKGGQRECRAKIKKA